MSAEVKPGDRLVSVDNTYDGPVIRGFGTVKRVTPTGIVVLEDDTRLNRSRFGQDSYEVRGRNVWSRAAYYRPDHEVVAEAGANTRKRNAANKVHDAYEAWRSDRDADAARKLAEAAQNFATEADA